MLISATTVAIALGLALLLRPSRTLQPEPPMPAPQYLPTEVRAAVRGRMQRHGADMRELLMRVVVLDHDGAARLAGKVHDEPGVGQSTGDAGLLRYLPPRFFALETALKAEAKGIVEAAAVRDPRGQAEHFATLTRTCVACHEAYLYGQPDPEDVMRGAAGGRR